VLVFCFVFIFPERQHRELLRAVFTHVVSEMQFISKVQSINRPELPLLDFMLQVTGLGDKLLLDSGCNRCHPKKGGLGVAAVTLIQMVDINDDKGLAVL